MHELGITEQMLTVALEQASKSGISKITRINLILGETSDISSESVKFYFNSLSKETPAQGAELCFHPASGQDFYIESIEGE
jgi:hydrogenase nickel incorporation protein HypA/HybF